MSASPPNKWLPLPVPEDSGIDRKALAAALLQIAHDLKPELRAEQDGEQAGDLQLEQLRTLLVGREIEALTRLRSVLEDPEKLAAAVGRVLPTAIAAATSDTRLGHVLAPAMEKATESSIRNNPRALIDILYPLIVPTIGKSIRETISETFQSLNQTLKFSLTWRGLRWRWEAWRTGVSFAEVVLKHSLVYQVEHVFLIHRHTGLLISHVAAENAASQDPQLVSSMLVAIQDFVRDSFAGAGQQGLDTLMLGELRLWCEPGPFAMLVAVIRGDPPEQLHETLRQGLSRIHSERHHALEGFDGDSSGFADVEAQLRECLAARQEAPRRATRATRLGRVIFIAWLLVMLLLAGAVVSRWWRSEQLWQTYVEQLQAEPGIVITETGQRDGKFLVGGMRDPLAADPVAMLRQIGIDPDRVISRWAPYESMQPQFVVERLRTSLHTPPTVTLAIKGDRTVAQGSAPAEWLDRAQLAAKALPTDIPAFDLSSVQNVDEKRSRLWNDYLTRLRAEPGIVITEAGQRDGKFFVAGLRDPLAADPQLMLGEAGVDPAEVVGRWAPYQALDAQFVLKRLRASLAPPPTVVMAIDGGRIVAQGAASSSWLESADLAARLLPPGAPIFDLSAVRNIDEKGTRLWNDYVARLRAEPGILVTEATERDDKFFVTGLRDPLAADPQLLLGEAGIDPGRVVGRWAPYQALDPAFVLKRLVVLLDPPASVTIAIDGDGIVARGSAPTEWLDRARDAARMLPAGAPAFDVSRVRDSEEAEVRLWAGYLGWLRAEPGIVITEAGQHDGKFFVTGLRDPLAVDPELLLVEAKIDPSRVVSRWAPMRRSTRRSC